MKKVLILFFLIAWSSLFLTAQEMPPEQDEQSLAEEGETRDYDRVFDDSSIEEYEEPTDEPMTLRDKVSLEAAYGFYAAFSPGWDEAPWYNGPKEYGYVIGAKMEALLSMSFYLTNELRVKNTFSFSVPDKVIFSIKEFYFEYDFYNIAFLQAGLYEIAWGISRFYPFTNLPARVPPGNTAGDAYIGRLKIPVGIGGFELIAMTRTNFMVNTASPSFNELAYGTKYNLALDGIDVDAGFYYYYELPLFLFTSIKTTLGNTELYMEALAAINEKNWDEVRFSGNLGFVRDFFNRKLTLMGEVYYNGESDSAWWRPKTDILDEEVVDLYGGFNGALAFIIRPGIIGMKIFGQCLYAIEEKSAWFVPGISISPGDNFSISLSVPMALGSRNGYYHKNIDKNNRPFSIMLGFSFNGKLRYTL